MGGESTWPPAADLGLQSWEGVLANCFEYSGFFRMDQEMMSSLEQSIQEYASQKGEVVGPMAFLWSPICS